MSSFGVSVLQTVRNAFLQLSRESVVAPLARGLHIEFIEFRFMIHFLVAEGASEAFDAPSFAERLEDLAAARLAAFEAHVSE